MSEEKKNAVTEEVKEEVRKLTEEELELVTGGVDLPGDKRNIQFINEKGVSIADKFI